MENKDLISIIVPVYNVEKYLENCINSILNQTYNNIEIVLVDDGSTDNSGKICNDYLASDKRIKVIHKKNGGLSSARNAGIDNSNGKYITFIDSDDDIEKDYVEYLYNLIKKYNTEMSICTYSIKINNNIKDNIGKNYEECLLDTKECLKRLLCEEGYTVSACAKMYNRILFSNIRFPLGKLNEDNGTTYKLIMNCKKIAYGNLSKYNYYIHENSITTSKWNKRKYDLIELTNQMCDDINSVYPELEKSIEKRLVHSQFSILRQMLNSSNLDNEDIKNKRKIIKNLKSKAKEILTEKQYNKREKIAIIALFFGQSVFKYSWNLYSRLRGRLY